MKSEFTGYYAPTKEGYQRLWKDALIVLDTNVLLDLYRLPAAARNDLLSLLDQLGARLWIPYHVALEFQRNRLTVISAERKVTDDALTEARDLFGEAEKIVQSLQIDKRGLDISPGPLLKGLKEASDKLVDALAKVHQSQLDIAIADPIREKLDALLQGKVGPAPNDQAALDALVMDGDNRFASKIPPGYSDAEKDKNPAEASFQHDGLTYKRKFGDLIVWRQLLAYVKADNIKSVLLVTADRKEDWWWREKGKTIGPRPELAREILRESQVELFWMYSSDQFLESAKQFVQAKVSATSISEIQEVARNALRNYAVHRDVSARHVTLRAETGVFNVLPDYEEGVRNWLLKRVPKLVQSQGFPDFIAETSRGLLGYETRFLRNLSRLLTSTNVANSMLRGYLEVSEGRLSSFTLIIVTDLEHWPELTNDEGKLFIYDRLDRLLEKYPISEIVIGYITSSNEFEPMLQRLGPRGNADWINVDDDQ